MKVLVLGAGVIGTTSAYYLAKSGHEVVVVDRQPGPALETSFANAGGVCPSFAGPWAAPGMPLKVMRWLFAEHAPLMLRPRFDLHQWRWLMAFLRNCTADRFTHNKNHMQRIAHYSKACLVALREETGIAYDHGTGGVLQIFRTEEEIEGGVQSARVLEFFGVPHRIVSAEEARRIESGLAAAAAPFAGGLHLPADETGDCHMFTRKLADLLRQRGVTFQFDTTIERLAVESGRLDSVVTSRGAMRADVAVVALASEAPFLLRPIDIDVPIFPVKGYAVTLPIDRDEAAPRSSVMDEHTKVMITRLGNRIRAAGVAEIAGYNRATSPRQCEAVHRSLKELFPLAADHSRAEYWAGLRPMTPDGPPYLGRTPIANLILNVGHGSNGWTQACGCGRIIADIVSKRPPDIDLTGFGLDRSIQVAPIN
jgi:D-amino-acid dehydrogenase